MLRSGDEDGATTLLCVDAREAAGMLGVNRRAVRSLVSSGKLEAKRDSDGAATRLLIPVASVERLRAEQHRPG